MHSISQENRGVGTENMKDVMCDNGKYVCAVSPSASVQTSRSAQRSRRQNRIRIRFKVRAQQLTKVLVRDQRHIGCQASGAFDAGEKSADEDSIDADMNECSEHFFTVHEEVRGEWIEIQVQYIHCHSVCACR